MKLFGKIVLAAVAVTSVIAFSSCSQETPVAAYQYKDADGNTLVFYGDEKEGSFTVSTPELKFNDKNNNARFDTTIYFLDAEGKRLDEPAPLTGQYTEVTVPSYAFLKGKYTLEGDESGKALTLSDVKRFDVAAADWATELDGVFSDYETPKTPEQLENDSKKNGYITKDVAGEHYIIKKTVVVSEYGKYEDDDSVNGDIDGDGVITIDGVSFDEVL